MGSATWIATPQSRMLVRRWGPIAAGAVLWWALYHWNRPFWNWVVHDTAGMDPDSHWGQALHFFFYDVSKIALLVSGVVYLVTVLRSFMSVERTRALLGAAAKASAMSPLPGSVS